MNHTIIREMEPLIRQAENEGLWLKSLHQGFWFKPQELRECQNRGEFLYNPVNWTLGMPPEVNKEEETIKLKPSSSTASHKDSPKEDPAETPCRIEVSKLEHNKKLRKNLKYERMSRIKESVPTYLHILQIKTMEMIHESPVGHYIRKVKDVEIDGGVLIYLDIIDEYKDLNDNRKHIAQIEISIDVNVNILALKVDLISDKSINVDDSGLSLRFNIEDLIGDGAPSKRELITEYMEFNEKNDIVAKFVNDVVLNY